MALGTRDGALIVKDGTLAQDCNCCAPGMCCKKDKHCTTVKASQCPASVGAWTSSRYGIVCPPSGCCCMQSNLSLAKFVNCLEGGCRPQQIDVTFNFAAPRKVFSEFVPTIDRTDYYEHAPVTFSGTVTLTPFQFDNQLYTFSHDPSGFAGPNTGLGEGFGNASAIGIVFDPRDLGVRFYFDRKCISRTTVQIEQCLVDTGATANHGVPRNYGTTTSDTTPFDVTTVSGLLNSYLQWTATLSFSQTQINSNCFCYGVGTTGSSLTDSSYIDYSVLSLPCNQRPFILNGKVRADDVIVFSSSTGAATLTITDAR